VADTAQDQETAVALAKRVGRVALVAAAETGHQVLETLLAPAHRKATMAVIQQIPAIMVRRWAAAAAQPLLGQTAHLPAPEEMVATAQHLA
jgi:hypothetical protein